MTVRLRFSIQPQPLLQLPSEILQTLFFCQSNKYLHFFQKNTFNYVLGSQYRKVTLALAEGRTSYEHQQQQTSSSTTAATKKPPFGFPNLQSLLELCLLQHHHLLPICWSGKNYRISWEQFKKVVQTVTPTIWAERAGLELHQRRQRQQGRRRRQLSLREDPADLGSRSAGIRTRDTSDFPRQFQNHQDNFEIQRHPVILSTKVGKNSVTFSIFCLVGPDIDNKWTWLQRDPPGEGGAGLLRTLPDLLGGRREREGKDWETFCSRTLGLAENNWKNISNENSSLASSRNIFRLSLLKSAQNKPQDLIIYLYIHDQYINI